MDILIIDDEGNLRRMLRSLLEAEDFTVREAASAEEGIKEVAREAPEASGNVGAGSPAQDR